MRDSEQMKKKSKFGDLYSALPSLSGRPYALRAECVDRVTQQTGNHNGRSRTATSRSLETANQNERLIHKCHCWDSNLRLSGC
jgi:hypothetical protein